jgi:hypothetical protein
MVCAWSLLGNGERARRRNDPTQAEHNGGREERVIVTLELRVHTMDSVAYPAGPNIWNLEATDGIVLGAIEQRTEGFVVVPSTPSPLADLDVPPYASLEAALSGVAAHLQGTCSLNESRP